MKITTVLTLLGIAIVTPQPATAACQWSNMNHYELLNDTLQVVGRCDSAGGGRAFRTDGMEELNSLKVLSHPANGKLEARDGAAFRFRPNPGFSGQDKFSIRVCATYRGIPGCSTLVFAVTVQ